MFNLDAISNKHNKDDKKKWPYRMIIIGPFGSGLTNALLNLIQKQDNDRLIDKPYWYAKDLSVPKYLLLIGKRENAGIKNLNETDSLIEYSDTMEDAYNNIDGHNPNRNLIVLDDMIADIVTNKKFQAVTKELFIRCRKLNISLVFITQSCFSVSRKVRLRSTRYLIMKIHNRRKLQNIVTNYSADIDYKEFLKIYRNFTKEP